MKKCILILLLINTISNSHIDNIKKCILEDKKLEHEIKIDAIKFIKMRMLEICLKKDNKLTEQEKKDINACGKKDTIKNCLNKITTLNEDRKKIIHTCLRIA